MNEDVGVAVEWEKSSERTSESGGNVESSFGTWVKFGPKRKRIWLFETSRAVSQNLVKVLEKCCLISGFYELGCWGWYGMGEVFWTYQRIELKCWKFVWNLGEIWCQTQKNLIVWNFKSSISKFGLCTWKLCGFNESTMKTKKKLITFLKDIS